MAIANNRNAYSTPPKKKDDLAAIEKVMKIDEKFKAEYVDIAHDVITRLSERKVITKTKIRSIYNMLCDIIANESYSTDSSIYK